MNKNAYEKMCINNFSQLPPAHSNKNHRKRPTPQYNPKPSTDPNPQPRNQPFTIRT